MNIKHLINKHRLEVFVVFFLIVVAILYFSNGTHAQPFYQGETLDPPCVAGDPGCTVDILSGAFSTTSNVTSNLPGDLVSDDFVFGSPTLDFTTEANRFFFDKERGAFRAGGANGNTWDDFFIGEYSFAAGVNTIAQGIASTAFGSSAQALADYSTAIGQNITVGVGSTNSIGFGLADTIPPPAILVPNVMSIMGGNVGIGTVSPSARLTIGLDGAITTTEKSINASTGASTTVDWIEGNQQRVNLGTNSNDPFAINFTANSYAEGQTLRLIVCHDGSPPTINWDSNIIWSGGPALILTTAAGNRCDVATFIATEDGSDGNADPDIFGSGVLDFAP